MLTPAHRARLESEVEIDTYKSSGPGGQKKNVTESAVRLRHRPTGLIVVATESRSQIENRETAFERLAARLAALQAKPKPRRPTKPTRASRERRLAAKKARSERRRGRGGRWDREDG